MNKKLMSLKLVIRRALMNNGIFEDEQIQAMTDEQLLNLRGIGPISLNKINVVFGRPRHVFTTKIVWDDARRQAHAEGVRRALAKKGRRRV